MIEFISLGEWCTTAYQIRRHQKNQISYMFDWLNPIGDSYKSLLMDDSDFFRLLDWEIIDDGKKFVDTKTGLKFRHEFPKNHDETINLSLLKEHLAVARSKFSHLKNKTLDKIKNSKQICLVCYMANTNTNLAEKKADEIFKTFQKLNPNLKVVIASEKIVEDKIEKNYFLIKIKKGNNWQGDNDSWDRLFDLISSRWSFD